MYQHFMEKPVLAMLYPMYATVLASTLAFDVDIKTVISVIGLVVSQLYLIIKWGVKIDSRLTKIEDKLDVSKASDEIAVMVSESIQKGINEVLRAHDRLVSDSATEAVRRIRS